MNAPHHLSKAISFAVSSSYSFSRRFVCLCSLFILFLGAHTGEAAPQQFNFTLNSGATTSAGAYKPDGTLVRTLWRKVYYGAGTHSYTWDGKDDSGADVPAGNYEFKLVAHNMQYVWEGAIGNTSASQTGMSVHKAAHPIYDLAISGTNAFYVASSNEANYSFVRFNTTAPQVVTKKWRWVYNAQFNRIENRVSNIWDRQWRLTATDGVRAYFGVPTATDPVTQAYNTHAGFITASNVSDSSSAPFANGVYIAEADYFLANGIYVGTQPGLSGLAVQTTGTVLAGAVRPDNKVYLFDKTSGAALGSIDVTAPGRLDFAPNGDLWVVSGSTVVRYTQTGTPAVWTVAATISGFSNPLEVAVHPTNNEIVLVADGGSSQQVKAYTSTGVSLWTLGTAGGYSTGNTTVSDDKFWFHNDSFEDTYIAFAADGSFWVGDGGNFRSQHFSATRTFIDRIAYCHATYVAGVDKNNPTRVFNEFLEFSIDYTKPVGTGWTLVKNWGAGLPPEYFTGFGRGLTQPVTLSNGRTYAIAWNEALSKKMLLELNGTSTRVIGPLEGLFPIVTTIRPNGDQIKVSMGTPSWTRRALTGFDAANNPVWGPETSLASAPNGATDPSPRCCSFGLIAAPITTSDVIVSYDQSLNNGFHLGGVKVGGTSWLWRGMPAVPTNVPLDGMGSYDIGDSVSYGGNTAVVMNRHIVAGYHGEFYRGQGQAGQYMHFYDNGLFLGQFGEPSIGHGPDEGVVAGFAGNGFSPDLTRAPNGEYYMYVNDESAHGPQRWHLLGANSIQEMSGSGMLGGSAITLTGPAPGFPTNFTATPGNGGISFTWTGVPGATSYIVKSSTTDGGPYTTVNTTGGTSYTLTGLTNGTKYFCTVAAVVGGVESGLSAQVNARPFDPSVAVHTAGRQSHVNTLFLVTSSAPASGLPALRGLNPYFGDLNIRDVGNRGYHIFNWGGYNVDNSNVLPPFTVTEGAGWANAPHFSGNFTVDGVSGSDKGLTSNPAGTIDIAVSDTNFHYLTVFCQTIFTGDRSFTISLKPQGQSSPVASYSVNESPGFNHAFQFLFKGNTTLTVDSSGGVLGTVQAIFLDNVAGTGAGTLTREWWLGIPGSSIAAMNWTVPPTGSSSVTSFEAPSNWADNYGARLRGFLTVPVSGSYTFWMASDDDGELWLSTNDQPAAAVKIAGVTGWTNPREWNKFTTQKSVAITLIAGQKYYVEARMKDGNSADHLAVGWAKPGEATVTPSEVIPGSQLSPFTTSPTGSGTITREWWSGIGGTAISAVNWNSSPTGSDTVTSLEGPSNWADSYGSRLRGYLTAPVSGNYTFWIATDDTGELWLSTNDQPATAVKIAEVTAWTSPRQWNKYTTQKSVAVTLAAGQRYYIEARMKDGISLDSIAVGWAKPGEATETPSEVIPGSQLSPF